MSKAKGSATETIEMPGGATANSSEVVEGPVEATPTPPDQLARVTTEVGFTRNVGNYNSVRYGVSLSLPAEIGEIEEVTDFAMKWCEDRAQGKMLEINEAYNLD